ncbi:hypothetical protein ABC666_06575, partial [Lacticaseibacillus paracasei]
LQIYYKGRRYGGLVQQPLAYMNSKVFASIAALMMPTIHFTNGQVGLIPYNTQADSNQRIVFLSKANVLISKTEWNNFEQSWKFDYHPYMFHIADHQKSPPTKLLIFFDFCDKYVPIQFRGLIFYGKLSKKR